MATWITEMGEGTGPLRVGIKDLIDVAGVPTTAGCRAVARLAAPATGDADCLAGLRAAVDDGGARIVGKANLHELAAGSSGINPWFGTPRNPLGARLVPGGSSSGCAVAVASGAADVAIGTDTAGSVRIPAACCGVVGLKPTWGRVALGGVWPLAPSFDTVGPLGADVAAVTIGMALLEAGFTARPAAPRVGRLRIPADPRIDRAVDAALRAAELEVVDVALPGWAAAGDATLTVLVAEAWAADAAVLAATGGIGTDVRDGLSFGATVPAAAVASARRLLVQWRVALGAVIARHGPVVTPGIVDAPPTIGDVAGHAGLLLATAPVNGAGLPAIVVPVPRPGGPPASLQLIGAADSEETLVGLAGRIEAAVGTAARRP